MEQMEHSSIAGESTNLLEIISNMEAMLEINMVVSQRLMILTTKVSL